jgi:hypothetical protein
MHVAVAVGTLILGGWVLHSPVDENESAISQQAPPTTAPAPGPQRAGTSGRGQGRDMWHEGAGRDLSKPGSASGRTERRTSLDDMPLAPTNSNFMDYGDTGGANQPSPPTSSDEGTDAGLGAVGSGALRSQHPIAPTAGLRSTQSGFRPTTRGTAGQGVNPLTATGSARFMTPQVMNPAEKPFSRYQSPSGVSPYLNLFRRGSGSADNYNTLVRPQFEQRYLNQQFGHDIGGLEQTGHMQGLNLQQLNQEYRTPQNVTTPQYYMNLGNYYPGYNGQ